MRGDSEGGDAGSPALHLADLRVPMDPGYVGLVRGVATTIVATIPELEEERIEDVRVAISEACTIVGAVEGSASTGRHLLLRCWVDGGWVRLEVSAPRVPAGAESGDGAARSSGDVDEVERGWGTQLLQALVDEAEVDLGGSDGEDVVRLGVRCSVST